MEKVKIATIVSAGEKTSQKSGKKYTLYNVTLADGRKGNAFDEGFKNVKEGQEIEIEARKGEGNYASQLTFMLPKPAFNKGGFPPKDYNFLKREAALRLAVEYLKIKPEDIRPLMVIAEEYLTFLNK